MVSQDLKQEVRKGGNGIKKLMITTLFLYIGKVKMRIKLLNIRSLHTLFLYIGKVKTPLGQKIKILVHISESKKVLWFGYIFKYNWRKETPSGVG